MLIKFTEQIKQNTPEEFEISIKSYFEQILGFKDVETTQIKGDYGADLIGRCDRKKYVIQVKFYSSPVNLKAVQEAYAAKPHYNADESIVVTNNTFTESAINLADSTNCILIDGEDLDRIFTDKLESFDAKIEYLKTNKIRSFKISNGQLINSFLTLKKQLNRQPTAKDIDELGEFSSSTYKLRWGRWNLFLQYLGETCLVDRDITDDDLIKNFVDVSSLLGSKKVPTISDMKKLGKYGVSIYGRRFKSWNSFLSSQGIKPTKRNNIPKDEFISEYKRVKTLLKKPPTKAEFNKHSNISSNSYRRLWGSWSLFLKEQGETIRDVSDQELINEYRKLKTYLDKQTLTQSDMNKKGKFSSSTYERRFGSWAKFLQKIGETPNVKREITKEDLLRDYFRISNKLNKSELSANEIKEYSNYSLSSFLKKFGSWNNCKNEAKKETTT